MKNTLLFTLNILGLINEEKLWIMKRNYEEKLWRELWREIPRKVNKIAYQTINKKKK